MNNAETIIETYTSALYTESQGRLKDPKGKEICWFDRLLGGGIRIPAHLLEKEQPLLVLISGPPGAGKSILSQQICYNIAWEQFNKRVEDSQDPQYPPSLILSTETPAGAIVDNLVSLGYRNAYVKAGRRELVLFGELEQPSDIKALFEWKCRGSAREPVLGIFDATGYIHVMCSRSDVSRESPTFFELVRLFRRLLTGLPEGVGTPKIVVLDSLNIVSDPDDRTRLFDAIYSLVRGSPPASDKAGGQGPSLRLPQVLMLILDARADAADWENLRHWEYLADLHIHLDFTSVRGYQNNFIEIRKSRFQGHVTGQHLVKLYGRDLLSWPRGGEAHKGPTAPKEKEDEIRRWEADDERRSNGASYNQLCLLNEVRNGVVYTNLDPSGPRPILREGGLFIFPSVAWTLSMQRADHQIVQSGAPASQGSSKGSESVDSQGSAQGGENAQREGPRSGAQSESRSSADALKLPEYEMFEKFEGPNNKKIAEVPLHAPYGRDCCASGWPACWLHEMLGGNPLEQGDCVALVGAPGTHKSLFVAHFLLDGMVLGQHTLYLNLSEPSQTVEKRFKRTARCTDRHPWKTPDVDGNLKEHLQVITQKPSAIMPEELVHRILYWIAAKKIRRVVVSAIDQWEASFPNLAASRIFVPALIETFRTHKVTSMIIGVDDPGHVLETCGLTANADIILEFRNELLLWPDSNKFVGRLSEGPSLDGFEKGVPQALFHDTVPAGWRERRITLIQPIRFPVGAGGLGIAAIHGRDSMPGPVAEAGEIPPRWITLIPLRPDYMHCSKTELGRSRRKHDTGAGRVRRRQASEKQIASPMTDAP